MEALLGLLAREYACRPGDFLRAAEDNVLTLPGAREGGRQYEPGPCFFHMATLGGNAVVTADARLHPFLETFLRGREGHWLFELPNLLPLERVLNDFGYTLTQTHHMFLHRREAEPTRPCPVRWLDEAGIRPFYGDPRFPNALCPRYLPERPDRLAVCALEGEEVIGMAGCSEDAPGWMQIGVDVLPAWGARGVGSRLVALLTERILNMGAVPFYGTSLSNYRSWNLALHCGYRPTWVEIGARALQQQERRSMER